MNSKAGGEDSKYSNSAVRAEEDASDSASQPYGPSRELLGNKASNQEPSDRNNSTAKSQKRQDLTRRKTMTKTSNS